MILGVADIADAAHCTAPMRYAKDENEILLGLNSRQLNSCKVLGGGMFCDSMSYLFIRLSGDRISTPTPDS